MSGDTRLQDPGKVRESNCGAVRSRDAQRLSLYGGVLSTIALRRALQEAATVDLIYYTSTAI